MAEAISKAEGKMSLVLQYSVHDKTKDFVVSGGVGDTCDRQAALSNPHLQVSNKDFAIFSVRALLSFS